MFSKHNTQSGSPKKGRPFIDWIWIDIIISTDVNKCCFYHDIDIVREA